MEVPMHSAREGLGGSIAPVARRLTVVPVIALALLALYAAPALAADATTTTLSDPPSLVYGQTASLTATVQNTTATERTPAGSVQFSIDASPAGAPVALVSGQATYTTPVLGAGAHTVQAAYVPESIAFAGSA